MDLSRIEIELKKRLPFPYHWGRKQSNSWDNESNFIYTTYSFKSLLQKIEGFEQSLRDYTLNRWYNFWSAKAAEYIFESHNNIIANKNTYDKLVDFTINNIPFDHKTSVFPKGFKQSYEYAKENKKELIEWLYKNQSQEGRKHLKNRLFIIMYDDVEMQHWKMKAEITQLKTVIKNYVENFSKKNLTKLNFGEGEILSDIIWFVKKI